ncbi:MAG: lysophospholipase [Candidatus Omnitrophota bacterium]
MSPLITDEKGGIRYQHWGAKSPQAILLLVHGLGGHSGRWDFLGAYFQQNGISSYAIELRGFGETEGPLGHIDSFNTYYKDIHRLGDIILNENPGKKIFLVGESMGGLISFMEVLREPDFFNGLICISPAFVSRLKLSIYKYLKIFFAMAFAPGKRFDMPFGSAMCTRDVEYQKVMDSDKREHRMASARLLCSTLAAQVRALTGKLDITIPVLFLLAGEDQLVDPGMSEKVFARLRTANKNIILYPGMYHALPIDSGREKVFEDIIEWVRDRIKEGR